MENIQNLIIKIQQSNFTEEEKKLLISKLEGDKPDLLGFLKTSFSIYNMGKTIRDLFDKDIGDLF